MTARVRRPLVASISLVLPLALSMSRFTGSESRATMATICSATTTLPCPTFIRCTATPLLLLKVLDLLAHLLEHTLARQRGLAQLQVVGLAGHRVHLAAQLLEQEIQRAADGTALVEHQRQLGQVGAQPRQLLGDVGLVGPHGRPGPHASGMSPLTPTTPSSPASVVAWRTYSRASSASVTTRCVGWPAAVETCTETSTRPRSRRPATARRASSSSAASARGRRM